MSNEEIELRARLEEILNGMAAEDREQLETLTQAVTAAFNVINEAVACAQALAPLAEIPDIKHAVDQHIIRNAPELYPEVEITHNDPSE